MDKLIDITPSGRLRAAVQRCKERGVAPSILRFVEFGPVEVLTPCATCKHRHSSGIHCVAFPVGSGIRNPLGGAIPQEILLGHHDHRTPFDGDGGIQWEPSLKATLHPFKKR